MSLRGRFLYPSLVRLHGGAIKEDSLKPFSAVPGPKPLPIIGNMIVMRKNRYRNRLYFEECFMKYGEIVKISIIGKHTVKIDPA